MAIDILESKVVGVNKETWYKLIGTKDDTKPTGEFPAGTGHTVAKDSTYFEIGTEIRYEFDGSVWNPKGQVPVTLIEKEITQNGVYSASSDNADGYSSVDVDVSNTYTAEDEGKVVDNGALVAQTARAETIIADGAYDTTTNNSVTVDVVGEYNVLVKNSSDNSFILNSDYVEKINILDGCLMINNASAFGSGLKELIIPQSVATINANIFANATNLEKITINKAEGSITGAPWGAPETTQVIWTG